MRRYDDPVDVRKGMVDGAEGPEQFLWRGHLWKVHDLVGHWVETGSWWESPAAREVLGDDAPVTDGTEGGRVALATAVRSGADLGAEREVWRVVASRGRINAEGGGGVFDLLFDWSEGSWRLARCLD